MASGNIDERTLKALIEVMKVKRNLDTLGDDADSMLSALSKDQKVMLKTALKEGKEFRKIFQRELGAIGQCHLVKG